MRGFDSSKKLLLPAVMRDDNLANNGEGLSIFGLLITLFVSVLKPEYNGKCKLT